MKRVRLSVSALGLGPAAEKRRVESAAPAPALAGYEKVTCLECGAQAVVPLPDLGSAGHTYADAWKAGHSTCSHEGRHYYKTERFRS